MTDLHDLDQRVSALEKASSMSDRNHTDLARAVTKLVESIEHHEKRLVFLENDRQDRRVREAAEDVKDEQLRKDVGDIKVFMGALQENNVVHKVNGMAEGFNRLFWLVISAIVTGAIGLIFLAMRGGFGG